ncbi:MAG: sigma-70 family RNA polymerase sigma factor [Ruminococcus sp.]|nr:sigma-70 family RNA polymerase sigma factor [Ruminococcus sp.]
MDDFRDYVERYARDLSRFCYKLCGNPHDAEDLFQDTWTKALDKYGKFDSSKSFKSWLFAICVNTYKNAGKLKYNSARIDFPTAEENERFLSSLPDTQPDVDSRLDLCAAIASLPKKHRIVITLYYFREFSRGETAQILDIPEGTVSSRLAAAKKLLKRRLYLE